MSFEKIRLMDIQNMENYSSQNTSPPTRLASSGLPTSVFQPLAEHNIFLVEQFLDLADRNAYSLADFLDISVDKVLEYADKLRQHYPDIQPDSGVQHEKYPAGIRVDEDELNQLLSRRLKDFA